MKDDRGSELIVGVEVKELIVREDDRGFLMEILRSDDKMLKKFGQVYITCVTNGVAKGWHYHKKQTDHFCAVLGSALVPMYDSRQKSKTKGTVNVFKLDAPTEGKLQRVISIPPGIWHGFTSITNKAYILNVPDVMYNPKKPDEFRLEWNTKDIPFTWPTNVKRGG